ncbi:disease resistance protein RGA2-like [Chenopodium quinoa]|uniref:disease resistance protein RGA2-like n=1 Tax=Chenopodium quinoa TaxID=63459 RepID=UPI000B77E346|nr:disease resistance protein RGA2-like [Chenopodium quinoa]
MKAWLLQQLRQNVDMSRFVGRGPDVDSLVDKLCNPSLDTEYVTSNSLSVVAITGFGGIGKSRLAKNVFEDKRVTDTFSQRIWIVVSEDFNIVKMLLKILEYVEMNGKEIASCSEVAVRKLKEKLEGQRYLLVLDDVWNTHQGLWNAMKSSLESIGGSKDSMILVTTRDKVVAHTMHASSTHELPELSKDDSWSLFKQVAFANKSPENISMLETTGEEIVRKCKGNPLAIKTIGGILQTKQHSYEWENIEQSELWDLLQDDETGILPSLKLSYKSTIICHLRKDWLRFNWMNATGCMTLPPLWVSDGGFQISELGCLPHVSGFLGISGLEVIKSKQDAEATNISEKSRLNKLGLMWNRDNDWVKQEEVLDGLKPNRNLRLLIIYGYGGEKFPSWIMRMDAVYSLIKIINLINCRRCQKLPTLGNLPSLEELEIRDMDRLEHIGAELYCNAEILTEDASSSSNFGVLYFPSLKKLQLCGLWNLREWGEPCSGVRSSRSFFPSLEELVIEDCPELTTTPNNFPSLTKLTVINNTSGLPVLNILDNESSLACLKNLHIDNVVELISLSQKLPEYCTSLQTLQIDRCKKLTCLPERLSKLVSLELLHICFCSGLESLPNLSSLASLRRLHIFQNDNLKYPPEGLQCCTSLEELWLSICSKIETLPDLTALTRLTILCIRGMPKMMSQSPDSDWIYSLPCLQVLHIGRYDQLDHFPDISPLLKITSLKNLLLYGWKNQDTLRRCNNCKLLILRAWNVFQIGPETFHLSSNWSFLGARS